MPEAEACARLRRADDSGTATEGERRQGRESGKLPEVHPAQPIGLGPPGAPSGAAGRGGAGEKLPAIAELATGQHTGPPMRGAIKPPQGGHEQPTGCEGAGLRAKARRGGSPYT